LAHFTHFFSDARRGTDSTAYCASQKECANCIQVCSSSKLRLVIKWDKEEV